MSLRVRNPLATLVEHAFERPAELPTLQVRELSGGWTVFSLKKYDPCEATDAWLLSDVTIDLQEAV